MRQPDSRLRRVIVIIPRKLTGLPALMYESVTGATRYAKPPSKSRCRISPSVMTALVTPAFDAQASNALNHSEQAPGPCHTCGGRSSMTTASSAHGAMSVLKLRRPKASVQRCTTAITSVLSDAATGVEVTIAIAMAISSLRTAFSPTAIEGHYAPWHPGRSSATSGQLPQTARLSLSGGWTGYSDLLPRSHDCAEEAWSDWRCGAMPRELPRSPQWPRSFAGHCRGLGCEDSRCAVSAAHVCVSFRRNR